MMRQSPPASVANAEKSRSRSSGFSAAGARSGREEEPEPSVPVALGAVEGAVEA